MRSLFRNKYSTEIFLLLFCLGVRCIYHFFLLPDPIFGGDTSSYLQASEHFFSKMFHGRLDLERTPLYPGLIATIRSFLGEEYLFRGIVLIQRAVSLLSVRCFYRMCTQLIKYRPIVFAATLYYACSPCLLSYNATLLTESLSISFVVFLFSAIVSYARSPGGLRGFLLGLSFFPLIMLRPAFLAVLPILTLFWLVRLLGKTTRRQDLSGLFGTVFSLLLLLGYCQLFRTNHGVFHVSIIPYLNQFHILIQSGLYRYGDDTEMNERIRRNIEEYVAAHPDEKPGPRWLYPDGLSEEAFNHVAWARIDDYLESPARLAEYAMRTMRKTRSKYVVYSIGKACAMASGRFCQIVTPTPDSGPLNRVNAVLNAAMGGMMRFGLVYLLLVWEAVAMAVIVVRVFCRRKTGSVSALIRHLKTASVLSQWHTGSSLAIRAILGLWIAGTFFTAIVGAQCDWSRLVMPGLPLVILLTAQLVDRAAKAAYASSGIRPEVLEGP